MAEKKKYPKGIYQRGNLLWLRYAGLDGKIVFEPTGTNKLRDAETQLHKRKAELASGKQPEIIKIKNYSFRELSEEYVKWSERQRGFEKKVYVIRQLVAEFGHYPLRRFDTRMIEQFQTERLQKGHKHATVNRHLATIKHMFTKAVEWDMVEEDSLKRVRKVKMLEENNRRMRFLSSSECSSLVGNCDKHLRPIVITALNTGMRKSEILNLKWDDVDLKHNLITVRNTKNGEPRRIAINGTLRDTLSSIVRRLDVPFVFFDNATGKSYGNVNKSFSSACRRSGITDFHFHDLRHTFASQLVMAGIDLTTVRELMGHKTMAMTLRYSHLAPQHMASAVNILDQVLQKNSTIQKLYKMKEVAND